MQRLLVGLTSVGMVSLMLAGCPQQEADLFDPPGSAPDLVGTWQDVEDETRPAQSRFGCLDFDGTGDLTAVRGNYFVQLQLGVNTLDLDGIWRPSNFNGVPIEYAGVAEVTQSGDTLDLELTATIRSFGLTIGTYTISAEGVIDGDTITGTMTEISNLPGVGASGTPLVNDLELERGDC